MSQRKVDNPCVLIYHRIAEPHIDTHLLAVRPENFEAHLSWLSINREVVPLYTLLQEAANGQLPPKRTALTFDDGYMDNLTNALPLLEKYKMHATVFVSSGYLSKPAFWVDLLEEALLGGHELPFVVDFLDTNWPLHSNLDRQNSHDAIHAMLRDTFSDAQIHSLLEELLLRLNVRPMVEPSICPLRKEDLVKLSGSSFIEIGAHCVGHPKLSVLDEEKQRQEIFGCCDFLEKEIGKSVRLFAYPYGSENSYNEMTRSILEEKGLYGIANIQDDLLPSFKPRDIPRRIVRDWSQKDFAAWMQSDTENKCIFEREAVLNRPRRCRAGTFIPLSQHGSAISSLHVNTLTGHGGASMVTECLVRDLCMKGSPARLLVGKKLNDFPHAAQFDVSDDQALNNYCHEKGLLYYSFQGSHALSQHPWFLESDILHLHNIHGSYFNPWSLSGLSYHRPTVWTLHDMQAITGHCAHSFQCERWQTGCGHCPHLGTEPLLTRDTTARLWRDKKYIYDNSALWIITPSEWLANKVSKSMLEGHPVICIPNGTDTAIFSPKDKVEARRRLGIPDNVPVLGGVADGGMLENKWKGGEHLLEVLAALALIHPNLVYLNIGGAHNVDAPEYLRSLPFIEDKETLSWAYAAMDIFLYPSLADNGPLTVVEALSCGIPVIAFGVGGIPEQIRNGIDGIIVPQQDTAALVQASVSLLKSKNLREQYSAAARHGAEARFSFDLFLHRYLDLYQNILHKHGERRLACRRLNPRKLPPIIFTPAFRSLEKKKPEAPWQLPTGQPLKNQLRRMERTAGPLAVNLIFQLCHTYAQVKYAVRRKYGNWKIASGYRGKSRVKGVFYAGLYVGKRLGQKLIKHSPLLLRRDEILRIEPASRQFGFDHGTPLDRYYIEKFLSENKESIRGHVLEIADDMYTRRFGRAVEKMSILNAMPSPFATIVGNFATGENIPTNAFDCVLLTQTVHVIYNIATAMQNAYNSLRPAGILLLTAPGISQISCFDMERWGDYWRFTDKSLKLLIEQSCPGAQYTVSYHGNLAVAKGFLDGYTAEMYPEKILNHVDSQYQVLLTATIEKPSLA